MQKFLKRVLPTFRAAALFTLACVFMVQAQAGRPCEPAHQPKARSLEYGFRMAQRTKDVLERSGADVVLLGRAGQDLSAYNLDYSHMGFAYRQKDADGTSVWRVLHKLNDCGSAEASLFRQGLGEFFMDNPWRYAAVAVVPQVDIQAKLLPVLTDNARATAMNVRPYSLVSYVWGQKYQQSNQWALETLAMALDNPDGGHYSRSQAQAWLLGKDYRPSVLQIGPLTRLGARVGSANVAFDDHPDRKRYENRIETVTVDSIVDWMRNAKLAEKLIYIHEDLYNFRAPERVVLLNGATSVRTPTATATVAPNQQQGYDAYRSKDYARAYSLLMPQAAAGDAQAQFTIGMMHRYGYGRPADTKEAMRWFHMAAEKDYSPAQYNLGSMYGTDPAVSRDYDSALYWLNRAHTNGNAGAKALLDQVQAQKLAQEQTAARQKPSAGGARVVVRPDAMDDVAECVRNAPTACTAAETEAWTQGFVRSLHQAVRYPAAAVQTSRTGEVLLSVSVCTDDRVARASVRVSSGHEDLDNAALQAARKTPVKAPFCSGVLSPINVTAPVTFTLDPAK